MLYLKIDVLEVLKEHGITQYKIRKDNLIGAQTVLNIKAGKVPGIKVIDTICRLLECQPGEFTEMPKWHPGKQTRSRSDAKVHSISTKPLLSM